MDNIKLLLIFLVIFAHCLECVGTGGPNTSFLYKIIYVFHMPAFIFLSGYFAKYNPLKILTSLVFPYIIFQTLYQAFSVYIIDNGTTLTLQYTTPWWILWYIFAMMFFYILLPLFSTEKLYAQALCLAASIAVSLLAGFDTSIGYYFSLSRIFTFFPYFLCGHFLSKWNNSNKLHPFTAYTINGISILGVILSIIYIKTTQPDSAILYGSYPYQALNYLWLIKLLLLFFGFCWIRVLLIVIPNIKFPFLSALGKNTMSIFLLHAFFVRLFAKYNVFNYQTQMQNVLFAAFLAFILVVLLGNDIVNGIMTVCTGKWLYRVHQKKHNAAS